MLLPNAVWEVATVPLEDADGRVTVWVMSVGKAEPEAGRVTVRVVSSV